MTTPKRLGASLFRCLVEVLGQGRWRIHPQVDASVDALLTFRQPDPHLRMHQDGKLIVSTEAPAPVTVHRRFAAETESVWLANLGKLASQMGDAII